MLFKIFFKNILRSWQTSWRGWLLPGKPALQEASELQHRRDDEAAAAAQHGGARGHRGEIRQAEEHDAEEHPRQRKVKIFNLRFLSRFNLLNIFSYHWPNGVLYYTIDAAFDSTERATIAAGMKMVEDNSCIRFVILSFQKPNVIQSSCYFSRFVARTNENDYVDIIPGGGGCYAQVPYRTGRGRMEIGLQRNGCVYKKVRCCH